MGKLGYDWKIQSEGTGEQGGKEAILSGQYYGVCFSRKITMNCKPHVCVNGLLYLVSKCEWSDHKVGIDYFFHIWISKDGIIYGRTKL